LLHHALLHHSRLIFVIRVSVNTVRQDPPSPSGARLRRVLRLVRPRSDDTIRHGRTTYVSAVAAHAPYCVRRAGFLQAIYRAISLLQWITDVLFSRANKSTPVA
jgi:hypothetical protein